MRLRESVLAFEKILLSAKIICVVGVSRDPLKDSHSVANYLQEHGFGVLPVNPAVTGKILGVHCFNSLSEITKPVDVVVVFRPSKECEQVVHEALLLKPKLVWLQLGIKNEQAKKLCEKAGIVFVQDKCIRTEHKRLTG